MNEYFKCVELKKKWMSLITHIYYAIISTLFTLTFICMYDKLPDAYWSKQIPGDFSL